MKPRVLDLFSGIGGFALAFEAAGFETAAFAEIEPYPCKILAQHWPNVPNLGDVKGINGEDFRGSIDVVCGGFPCQDISTAGKGAGIHGARSGLWFEMLRIIRGSRPAFCLLENVPALRTRGADDILEGLEKEGYACRAFVVGAGSAGAAHQRFRVWVVAYALEAGLAHGKRVPAYSRASRRSSVTVEAIPDVRNQGWLPEPGVGVFVDGLSKGVDQVAALGNSIVPAVCYPFAVWIRGQLTKAEA